MEQILMAKNNLCQPHSGTKGELFELIGLHRQDYDLLMARDERSGILQGSTNVHLNFRGNSSDIFKSGLNDWKIAKL